MSVALIRSGVFNVERPSPEIDDLTSEPRRGFARASAKSRERGRGRDSKIASNFRVRFAPPNTFDDAFFAFLKRLSATLGFFLKCGGYAPLCVV